MKTNEYTKCDEFTTLPTEKCYPINYGGYKKFFEENGSISVFETINKTEAFFVHIWNKMQRQSPQFRLTFNSSAAYIGLAKHLCPNVLQTVENYF